MTNPAVFPDCWAHRGASLALPENTLASFEKAIKDGCDGIESDIHRTEDGVIVMFHDPTLNRVTNGNGKITTSKWHGYLDQLRTTKEPSQPLTTLPELLHLLNQPGNEKVVLNLDIKPTSDPELLFTSVKRDLEAASPGSDALNSRIVLGLWHPKYLEPAMRLLPSCRRIHISWSMKLTEDYFWKDCHGFSINFVCLMSGDGEVFRQKAKAAGKDVYTWTVNDRSEMIAAIKMGLKCIMTDEPSKLRSLYDECRQNWDNVSRELGWFYGWFTPSYYSWIDRGRARAFEARLKSAGSFDGKEPDGAKPGDSKEVAAF